MANIDGNNADNFDLMGTNEADVIRGFGGTDHLYGHGGNDTLNGGLGGDLLLGGPGIDVASYENAAAPVVASLLLGAPNGGEAAGDTYEEVENILGSAFDDFLIGNAGANALGGGSGGNDNLTGWDGNDLLAGGIGNDVLNGGNGADILDGGDGIDLASYVILPGGAVVADLLNPGANTGAAAGDTYFSIENILGTYNDDILRGNDGANELDGGALGDDVLQGRGGNDVLLGDDGDDKLNGGLGADTLDGGFEIDVASYQHATTGVFASLESPFFNTGEAAGDIYVSIENLLGSAFGDTLIGNGGDNALGGGSASGIDVLFGLGGNDLLAGGSGDDKLSGGLGGDTLEGGLGNDLASYEAAASGVIADLVSPGANTGEAAGDTYSSIERVLGSTLGDTLLGNDGNNALGGGTGGNDVLSGRGGTDELAGGFGDDVLNGGLGADALYGADGTDVASYESAATGVLADLLNSGANIWEAAGDTYSSIENLRGSALSDTLRGNDGANRLEGGSGDDALSGRGGSDVLIGAAGNDELEGGLGADALDGGSGIDLASYENAAAGVTASLLSPGSNAGEAAGDTYAFIENLLGSAFADTLIGNDSANTLGGGTGGKDILSGRGGSDVLAGGLGGDTLSGGLDADFLSGQEGSDVLIGGLGRDVMSGALGDDVFDFNSVVESGITSATRDIVSDFTLGHDRINLATIDAGSAAGDQAFTFIGAAAFTGEGQIRALEFDGYVVLQFNTQGPGTAEMTLQLSNVDATLLTAADFVL